MNDIETLLYKHTISIVNCIAKNNYELLDKKGCLNIFSKEEIIFALSEYGGTVSLVEKENYNGRFDCYKCPNDIYETEFDLIIDESLSDLTMICEFKVVNGVIITEEITDIHVL